MVKTKTKDDKSIDSILEEAGLNSVYRYHVKGMDKGLVGGNKPTINNYSDAEKCFQDPQVSTCFLIVAFALMKKKLVCEPSSELLEEGKKRDILKSKKIASFINFSLKKLKDGGVRQLQFDLITSKFFGFSLLEKVYDVLNSNQSSKYANHYYYKAIKSKRPGLWDFVYDDKDNVIGYRSLINRLKVWKKNKFLHMAYLPLFNNPNGSGDYNKVWKFWDAKLEFIIFLLDLASRLAKGKRDILKGTSSYQYRQEEVEDVLQKLTDNLAVYLPPGLELDFSVFDFGALQYFLSVLRWLDSQIAIAMLGSSLSVNESSQGTGTYAQSQTHMENSISFMDYMEGIICDTLTEQYMSDLIKLNFDTSQYPEEIWPEFKMVFEKSETPLEMAALYEKLKNMGVLDMDTETDITFLREKFNLPDNPELFDIVEGIIKKSMDKTSPDDPAEEEDDITSEESLQDDPQNMADFYI